MLTEISRRFNWFKIILLGEHTAVSRHVLPQDRIGPTVIRRTLSRVIYAARAHATSIAAGDVDVV